MTGTAVAIYTLLVIKNERITKMTDDTKALIVKYSVFAAVTFFMALLVLAAYRSETIIFSRAAWLITGTWAVAGIIIPFTNESERS